MAKHIKSYFEKIDESVGFGAVVLIKGKEKAGKKSLYATHVIGSAELYTGVTMLFLSNDFYRITRQDGQLRSAKIAFSSEDALRSVLNLKTPGKISVVKNNNKTPWHWKTLKHANLQSALREIEDAVDPVEYILESADSNMEERDQLWNEFYSMVVTETANTAFFNIPEIDILSHEVSDELKNAASDASDESASPVEWDINFRVLCKDTKYEKYLQYFDMDPVADVTFMFSTEFEIRVDHDPGDYWTPPYTDSEFFLESTETTDFFVDGGSPNELPPQLKEIKKRLNSLVYRRDDGDLDKLIKKNVQPQWFSKYIK